MKSFELEQGMLFRSKTHPQNDISVCWCDDTHVGWLCANEEAFDKYVSEKKGVKSIKELLANGKDTFPYPFSGECSRKSFMQRLKKYNLELVS